MKRFFLLGCVLLVATACGAGTAVTVAEPGSLPAGEWCAEYRQVISGAGADQQPPALDASGLAAMMGRLRDLAGRAPVAIRDDLRAVWTVPEGMLGTTPLSDMAPPAGWEQTLGRQMERPMQWLADNCGDEAAPELPDPAGLPLPPDTEPIGDWQAVQHGTAGPSQWTFFRTGAADGRVCVAFEAEPGQIDWRARIRASAPPGTPLPPDIPLPPVVGDAGGYKGKLPQCGPAPDLFERSDPVVFWVQDEDATNRFNVIAGLVVDSARSLTVTFSEGAEQRITPVDGTFVVTYDPHLHVARVVPDLGAGSDIVCEPLTRGVTLQGLHDFLSLSCQGSYTRAGLPVPPFGLPRR